MKIDTTAMNDIGGEKGNYIYTNIIFDEPIQIEGMKKKVKETGWIKSRDTIQELITSSSDNININFNDTDIIEQIKQNLDDENVEKILKQASASEIELVVSGESSDEIKTPFNYKIYMAETYKKNKRKHSKMLLETSSG